MPVCETPSTAPVSQCERRVMTSFEVNSFEQFKASNHSEPSTGNLGAKLTGTSKQTSNPGSLLLLPDATVPEHRAKRSPNNLRKWKGHAQTEPVVALSSLPIGTRDQKLPVSRGTPPRVDVSRGFPWFWGPKDEPQPLFSPPRPLVSVVRRGGTTF